MSRESPDAPDSLLNEDPSQAVLSHVGEGLVLGSVNHPSPAVPDAPRWFNRMLAARQYTISAGTRQAPRGVAKPA